MKCYEVFVNGESIGVVGDPDLNELQITISIADDEQMLAAIGLKEIEGKVERLIWIEDQVGDFSKIEIKKVKCSKCMVPKYKSLIDKAGSLDEFEERLARSIIDLRKK